MTHKCKCGKICKSAAGLKLHQRGPKCPNKCNNLIPTFKTTNTSNDPDINIPTEVNTPDNVITPPVFLTQVSSCCHKRCLTCAILKNDNKFCSTMTNVWYLIVNHDPDVIHLNCASTNLIYLLTCNKCFVQYTGETAQKRTSHRMSDHIRSTEECNANNDQGCRYLKAHFTQGPCKGETFSLNIIEKLKGNGRNDENELSTEITEERRSREQWWIKELKTAYPYGLNVRVGATYFNHENTEGNISYAEFNNKPKLSKTKKRGKHKPKSVQKEVLLHLDAEKYADNLMEIIKNSTIIETFTKARKMLFTTPKQFLKSLKPVLMNRYVLVCLADVQKFDLVADLLNFKIRNKSPQTMSKNKTKQPFMTVQFVNKGVEMVNLSRILNNQAIKKTLPFRKLSDRNRNTPLVSYTYTPTIRNKILNYKMVLEEFDLNQHPPESHPLPCDCSTSSFIDHHYGHVITGDLNIINNERLRKLLSKGSNYREYQNINWGKVLKSIKSALQNFIANIASKTHMAETCFSEYTTAVCEEVKTQIELLKQRYPSISKTNFVPVLKDPGAVRELKELQQKYVFTPVDKASKNIALICRSFYLSTIVNEVYSTNDQNNVYKECPNNESMYVTIHHNYMKSISMPFDAKKFNSLPRIYMIPKFHKKPVKFRFIVASNNCSSKPLSNAISKALQKVRTDRQYACEKSEKFDGVNKYWIIDSSKPILDCLERLNEKHLLKSITTYDFTNLYTSLPHDDIIRNMSTLITDVFNKRTNKGKGNKLSVYTSKKENTIWSKANWVHKPRSSTFYFTMESLINSIRMQLDSTYFVFGQCVFQQHVGIPMGTDDGPEIANLTLHQQEFEYMKATQTKDVYKSRQLNKTYRFIDDITNFNAYDMISKVMNDIYGNVIKLNKENEGMTSAHVLDLTINIDPNTNTANTSLFDKRRDFNFTISNFPDVTGNVSNSMAYGIIPSQLLRYYKACSTSQDFLNNVTILTTKLQQQSYNRDKIIDKVRKFVKSKTMSKYGTNTKIIMNTIINYIPDNIIVTGRP